MADRPSRTSERMALGVLKEEGEKGETSEFFFSFLQS
jgi:hypothetical protein